MWFDLVRVDQWQSRLAIVYDWLPLYFRRTSANCTALRQGISGAVCASAAAARDRLPSHCQLFVKTTIGTAFRSSRFYRIAGFTPTVHDRFIGLAFVCVSIKIFAEKAFIIHASARRWRNDCTLFLEQCLHPLCLCDFGPVFRDHSWRQFLRNLLNPVLGKFKVNLIPGLLFLFFLWKLAMAPPSSWAMFSLSVRGTRVLVLFFPVFFSVSFVIFFSVGQLKISAFLMSSCSALGI